jgi:hypothetical protein
MGTIDKEGATSEPGHSQPEAAEVESARLLENDAAGALEAQGVDRDEVRRLADTYVAEGRAADLDAFIAWAQGKVGGKPRI